MTDSLIIHGRLYCPFFIFVRCAGRISDREFLNQFGLSTYLPAESARLLDRHTVFANDDWWTMIADDWYYTLWHMETTRPTIEKLGKSYDVFTCFVGDCDHSYDFVYYHNSRLVRKYVVTDPNYDGGRVAENKGVPLPGEEGAFEESNELKRVLRIADSLGIRTDYTEEELRVYAPEKRG